MLGSSIIFSVLLLFSVHCFSQQPEYLLKFIDSTTMKAGYKTLDGNIHFSATLDEGSTMANTFYTIVSAYEIRNDVRYHFYLLRNGTRLFERKVKDNDFLPFCESEGKIGFYDAVKRKFGFLNSSGKVIIPAIYDGVHRVVNGVCLVDKAKASAKRDEGEMPEAMDEFLINEKRSAGKGLDMGRQLSQSLLYENSRCTGRYRVLGEYAGRKRQVVLLYGLPG